MRPVSPRIGWPEVTLAVDQHEYRELTAAIVPYDEGGVGVVTRWRLEPEELARLQVGEDLYLTLLTSDGRPQPVVLSIGDPHG